jgi:hypothetical protein
MTYANLTLNKGTTRLRTRNSVPYGPKESGLKSQLDKMNLDLIPNQTKRIRTSIQHGLHSDSAYGRSKISNSDIGLIRTPVHLGLNLIRTFLVQSPGIQTLSIQTLVREPMRPIYTDTIFRHINASVKFPSNLPRCLSMKMIARCDLREGNYNCSTIDEVGLG